MNAFIAISMYDEECYFNNNQTNKFLLLEDEKNELLLMSLKLRHC